MDHVKAIRAKTDLRQILQRARESEQRGDFNAIITSLSALRTHDFLPDIMAISDYYYLLSFSLYRLGRYAEALPRIRAAIRLSQGSAEHAIYARQKQLLGTIYELIGRRRDAMEAFVDGYAARKRCGDFVGLYASLTNIGLNHMYVGDLAKATEVLGEAIYYGEKYKHPNTFLGKTNLCVAAMLRGDFRLHEKMLNSLRSTPLGVEHTAHFHKHNGQGAVWKLQREEADTELKSALVTFARLKIRRHCVVCLEYLGMNEYFAGNYQKAREYYEQVLAMPEPTASAVAQTLRMLADVYIAEKDWKRAKETAARAEAAITKINERIELGALWRAQAQIAEHDGDNKTARTLLERSLELLQQCGARYELALTHLAAGQSQCLDHAQRCEHLSEAKALFVEMEVPNRVTQIDLAALEESSRFPIPSRSHKAQDNERVIITRSRKLQEILRKVERARDSNLTVLITGETGTGKDLLAEYIHGTSRRAKGPYVNMNMAVLPDSLIESELFGFTRGSFTGATDSKPGLIESANGGTFCLNEIAEIHPAMQAKLLRVIEAKTVRRLGEMQEREVDVRFIAITNRDLPAMIRQNLFREDLYQRLAQVVFHLPPLRERVEDIPILFEHFVRRFEISLTKIAPTYYQELIDCLCERHWQGNIRELYTFTEHLAMLNGDLTDIAIQELIFLLRKKR